MENTEAAGWTVLLAAIVSTLVTAVGQVGMAGLRWWQRYRAGSQSLTHRDELHRHEMTVRLRVSEEYERVISQLSDRVDLIARELTERTDERQELLIERQRLLVEMAALHEERRRRTTLIDQLEHLLRQAPCPMGHEVCPLHGARLDPPADDPPGQPPADDPPEHPPTVGGWEGS